MTAGDVIEREMVFKATRSEVWAALTTPEGLSLWWCLSAEVDLRPGGAVVWDFGTEHGTHRGTIVAVQPEEFFALTWQPFQTDPDAAAAGDLTTRVEFRLEDHPHGTLLKLRETGFAALPGALAAGTLHENEYGWDEQLTNLRYFLDTSEKRQPA